MPAVRKRGHDLRRTDVDGVAFQMGYLCRRVLAFDIGVVSQCRKRERSPDHRAAQDDRGAAGVKDAFHWRRLATAKSGEVSQLRETLATREREYAALFEMNSRLVSSYRELERKTADAERELNLLRPNPFESSPAACRGHHINTIPIHTQGRDVFYWHQMCRTFQAQYLDVRRDADDKNRQCALLANRIKELEAAAEFR